MAEQIDTGPTTSYSDPIYDRLEVLSQRIRRQWGWVLLAIIVMVVLAVGLRTVLHRAPDAATVSAYIQAREEQDPAKLRLALQAFVDDQAHTVAFRARAACELVQLAIERGDKDEARALAKRATELAAQAKLEDLQLDARLSQAAVAEDAGEFDEALAHYTAIESAAGSRHALQALTAVLGRARTLHAKGEVADAATVLEGIIGRTDAGAESLLEYARYLYWTYKREVAGEKREPAPAPAAAPAPGTAPVDSAAPTGVAPAPAAPAAPAPAPAAAAAAPAVPAASPAPAASPEPAAAPQAPPAK